MTDQTFDVALNELELDSVAREHYFREYGRVASLLFVLHKCRDYPNSQMPWMLTYLIGGKYRTLWFADERARDAMLESIHRYKFTDSYVLSFVNMACTKKSITSYERTD